MPEHGVVVRRGVRGPSIVVGRTQAMVLARVAAHGDWCGDPSFATTFAVPVTAPASVAPPSDDDLVPYTECDASVVYAHALLRIGDTPRVVTCYSQDENGVCQLEGRPATTVFSEGLPAEGGWHTAAFATYGGTAFGARFYYEHEIESAVLDDAGHRNGELGTIPRGLDLEHPTLVVVPQSADRAIAWLASGRSREGTRITFGRDGHRIGEPTPGPRPFGPSPWFETETGEAPHVRFVRGETLAPIGGLDDATPTYHGRGLTQGTTTTFVYSEGTGHTTHIRAAILDPSAGAIVGTPIDVSTPGAEADVAEIDAFGDHAVVAWDELDRATWTVRAAEIVCE